MNISQSFRLGFSLIAVSFLMSACSMDKLEARLLADPQCKPVMNQKTGALMPCPGSDKEFYRSVPALNTTPSQLTQTPDAATKMSSSQVTSPKITVAPTECKPQFHSKSGSLMPCPAL